MSSILPTLLLVTKPMCFLLTTNATSYFTPLLRPMRKFSHSLNLSGWSPLRWILHVAHDPLPFAWLLLLSYVAILRGMASPCGFSCLRESLRRFMSPFSFSISQLYLHLCHQLLHYLTPPSKNSNRYMYTYYYTMWCKQGHNVTPRK